VVRARGLLFDSGDTLIRPIGGRWNPRFDFENVVLRHHPDAPTTVFERAFAVGQAFLDASVGTAPRDEYHQVILAELGIQASRLLLDELNAPLDRPPVEPFEDVSPVLAELRARGLRMAIVTDNWGTADSVRRTYDLIGLEGYFDVVVVSEELGCNKPDPRMYQTASDALGLRPGECLFVDDDAALVAAAIVLGYRGVAICRGRSAHTPTVPTIDRFSELLSLV
jgi:HAD superfamily hydrolase (TIGR01509 family)